MKANINWVTDTLATGGDLDYDPKRGIKQIDDIIDSGITHIIDMRIEDDDAALWECFSTVTYTHAPTNDREGYHILPEVFDAVVGAARVAADGGHKTLVHCHMGINRGPSGAFAVLLDRGHDPIEAFDMVRKARPEAAVYFAEDALHAHQKRQGTHDTPAAGKQRKVFRKHLRSVWTDEEQTRIAHVIRKKHGFDLRRVIG